MLAVARRPPLNPAPPVRAVWGRLIPRLALLRLADGRTWGEAVWSGPWPDPDLPPAPAGRLAHPRHWAGFVVAGARTALPPALAAASRDRAAACARGASGSPAREQPCWPAPGSGGASCGCDSDMPPSPSPRAGEQQTCGLLDGQQGEGTDGGRTARRQEEQTLSLPRGRKGQGGEMKVSDLGWGWLAITAAGAGAAILLGCCAGGLVLCRRLGR